MKKNQDQISKERKLVHEKILEFMEKNFLVPTLDEIGAELGLAKSVVRLRLKELEASGDLVLVPGRARGILVQYDAFKASRTRVSSSRGTTSRPKNAMATGYTSSVRTSGKERDDKVQQDLNAYLVNT